MYVNVSVLYFGTENNIIIILLSIATLTSSPEQDDSNRCYLSVVHLHGN